MFLEIKVRGGVFLFFFWGQVIFYFRRNFFEVKIMTYRKRASREYLLPFLQKRLEIPLIWVLSPRANKLFTIN